MPADLAAAARFIHANARVLERHRLAVLLDGAPVEPVLAALRAYRNPDGGFGHGLEPDLRSPGSEPVSTQHALDVLAEVGAVDDPLGTDAADWLATIAGADGGVPFVLPEAADYPHAPWMEPSEGGSQLTFALAGALWQAKGPVAWLEAGTHWCWDALAKPQEVSAYQVKFGLEFLDHVPDEARATAVIKTLQPLLDPDGSMPVGGGVENERLTPLDLAPRPGARSRALLSDERIEAELDRLESEQRDDGGWTFDWLGWSPGQTAEWRGIVTLRAVATLVAHRRLAT